MRLDIERAFLSREMRRNVCIELLKQDPTSGGHAVCGQAEEGHVWDP